MWEEDVACVTGLTPFLSLPPFINDTYKHMSVLENGHTLSIWLED